jgi:Fe2+ or Zn2+ uptake regulation protein
MTSSLIVSLLSQRPSQELEAARDTMRSELERLRVELSQVEEALARQSRRTARPQRSTGQPGSVPQRVLAVLAEHGGPTSPAAVVATLREQGFEPKRGAVHTTLARLVKSGSVTKLGEGVYEIASRNGSSWESHAGTSENGSGEPLFPATRSQEGANE